MNDTVDFSLRVIRSIPGSNRRADPDNMWDKSGVLPDITCVKCNKPVHWSRVSSNGHIRAVCETPNCFGILS